MGKTTPPPASFEAALAELEAIVREMEAGALPLEQSLAAFERGTALLKHCQDALGAAEQKLQTLEAGQLSDFASGAPAEKE
ncbi:exodeoxyribonuclease 7 small subunit [mine drainage metagenome]|uniref:Exodeoxyribonuclease 7 small subunit n=1 Tax=mine drainage metagenome TaxID=410659 RepID=A0A1J5SV15_9ZZZZ